MEGPGVFGSFLAIFAEELDMVGRQRALAWMQEQFRIAGFPTQERPIPWSKRIKDELGDVQREFEAVLDMCCTVRILKLREYGIKYLDIEAWPHPGFGQSAHFHDLYRKWQRLETLIWGEHEQDTTPLVIETLLDMVNYSVQFIQVLWRLRAWALDRGLPIGIAEESGLRGDTVEDEFSPHNIGMVHSTSVDPSVFQYVTECPSCEHSMSFSLGKDAKPGVVRAPCPRCHFQFLIYMVYHLDGKSLAVGATMLVNSDPETWPTGITAPPPQEDEDEEDFTGADSADAPVQSASASVRTSVPRAVTRSGDLPPPSPPKGKRAGWKCTGCGNMYSHEANELKPKCPHCGEPRRYASQS